jgi:hypothetical protein
LWTFETLAKQHQQPEQSDMGSLGATSKPHAVCVPYPAQGHITPMLNVAKLLHARGFDVTFVNTEYNHARLVRTRGEAAVAGVPGFRFATIPDGLPPSNDDDVTQDIPSLCKSTTETCLGPFRRLLVDLNNSATGNNPPVSCVVSDVVMGFSIDAAKELGVPYVQLWTASTISFLGYQHYRLLSSRGLAPLKGTVTHLAAKLFCSARCVPSFELVTILLAARCHNTLIISTLFSERESRVFYLEEN